MFRVIKQFQNHVVATLLLLSASFQVLSTESIVVWERSFRFPDTVQIIRLALEKTAQEFGPYELRKSPEMVQERAILDLARRGGIDIGAFVATERREDLLNPIRFPYLQGLLGLRICVVRENGQKKFESVESLEEFISKDLTMGVGEHWPERRILRNNGLKVVSVADDTNLKRMLREGRFDCLLKSAADVSYFRNLSKDTGLKLERHILFVYPSAQYIFVNPNRPDLFERFSRGIRQLKKDGTYREVFEKYHGKVVSELSMSNRTPIVLFNDLISRETAELISKQGLFGDFFKKLLPEFLSNPKVPGQGLATKP